MVIFVSNTYVMDMQGCGLDILKFGTRPFLKGISHTVKFSHAVDHKLTIGPHQD